MRLDDIATLIRGVSYKPVDIHSELDDHSVTLLKNNNVNDDGTLSFEKVVYVDRSKVSPNQLLRPGDIIVCASGSETLVGKAAQFNKEGEYTFGAFCKVVRPLSVNRRFLGLFFMSPHYRSVISASAQGAILKNLRNEHLLDLVIECPETKLQEEIVSKLDRVISIIQHRKDQLRIFDDLIKARFVEMFGDMLINPKGLPEQRLDSLADIVSGITKGRKVKTDELYEVPYMAVSNVKDGYIDWTTVKTIMATAAEIDQYRLMPGDVLMTEGGDPDKLGRGAIIYEPPKDCIHQNHIFRVRLKQDILLSVFMAQYLQQQKAKRYFLGCAKQTTGIASINMRQLLALPVLVPPMKEQEEYAAFVAQIDKSKVAVQKALDEAQLLFDSLMQQYFG